ncbi:MAG: peptidoglycan DD-metalloendopeptidase family protein [Campylobacter sp.]|nr:peptidoglycan DD-metalloendopeptidase family protein [Campylobacter sp.]
MGSKNSLEHEMVNFIVNDFSFDLVQDEEIKTTQSLLSNEIFKSLNNVVNEELKELLTRYDKILKDIATKEKDILSLEKNLKEYNAKKEELTKEKQKQENLVANLNKNKESYIVRLEKAANTSSALTETLAKLKIIDDEEEREKAKIKEEKRRQEQDAKSSLKDKTSEKVQETSEPVVANVDKRIEKIDQKVKLYGSSYQESRVKKYSGAKTISPLKDGYVKRKFGNYTDPVYGIKIFNESVVLGSKSANAQVLNVLDGKVIFAKHTPVLENVIIVEHKDGIHTIYAHLNQIAPTVKIGSKIKKGYAIGRISEDLTFEVTQKNYHINPLELISL